MFSIHTLSDERILPIKRNIKKKFLINKSETSSYYYHFGRENQNMVIEVDEQLVCIEEEKIIPEAIYGGILFTHFGHFIAESIHRLWPSWIYPEFNNMKIAYHVYHDVNKLFLADYMKDIFRYLKISEERIILINKPILFKKIYIPAQAKILGGEACAEYIKLFQRFGHDHGPKYKNVYVSRRYYMHAGSYLGETLVEKCLENAGFHIIYPEKVRTSDLINIYRSAENIVFSEGSAIHALEISGGINANVFIVGRRLDDYVKCHFIKIMKFYCQKIEGFFPKDRLSALGKRSPAIIDIEKLLEAISSFTGTVIDIPTSEIIEQAKLKDVLQILFDPRSTKELPQEKKYEALMLLGQQLSEKRAFPGYKLP